MKRLSVIYLLLLTLASTALFSQVKYDAQGDFGIGTTSPSTILHIVENEPVVKIECEEEETIYLRFNNDGGTYQGAYLLYDDDDQELHLGVHHSENSLKSSDNNILTIHRDSGDIEFTPTGPAYEFKSFVTHAPNYETRCYAVDLSGSDNFWVDGDGDVWHNGLHTISDISLKENIEAIPNSISLLTQLHPVKYNFKTGAFGSDVPNEKVEFGLIAQEVEEIIPDIVSDRPDGLKAISYIELIPILIDAVQSQQNELDELKSLFAGLSEAKKESVNFTTEDNPVTVIKDASLFQNIPNPFDENTIIKYSIPDNASNAMINVYDLQGSQVKSYNIQNAGDGEVLIPASELKPGLFVYNLIVDGTEVSSKRMILTD
ncbi:MAG TPA: tail fiber domain-containing protein [Bacteroidales bacterium]|nr:tail fiber domain-containing protein [Bacteroidales bacterium]